DLDAHAEPPGDVGGVAAELGGVLGEGRVPGVGVRDAADRQHHPDAAAGEVADDLRGDAARDAVDGGGVVGEVQQLRRVDEAEHDDVDRRAAVAAVDEPVVLRVELGDRPGRAPGAEVVAAVPGAVDLHRGDRGRGRRGGDG